LGFPEISAILMVKLVPILGTLVLLGAIVQVFLGFQVAAKFEMLLMPHITFGVIGLILVIALAAISFKTKISTLYSKVTISILAIVVLLQVVLGFLMVSGTKGILTSHEANGFLVVLLSLVMGGITSMSARKQRTLPT
jgi:hypothetical protein